MIRISADWILPIADVPIGGGAVTLDEGRIVSVLEGGYELHALGRSVAAHLKVLGEL